MSKLMKIILISVGAFLFVILVSIGVFTYYINHPSLDRVPYGKLVAKLDSPNHDYTARIFNISMSGGGPSVGPSVRVEIAFNKTNKKPKTIYYDYEREYSGSDIEWLSDQVIKIYDHRLNVLKDTYNWENDPNWDKKRGE
ncbi:DUF5412 family protein [Sporolactobacillus sp. CQH2019]|uniref:DUF5412 family protein n=1 Tax=Sporolactobacillus sp. CQH2019 TaxID=3023512 RepID=UPI00236798F6|nr:DUF5412 family protein [Sporolactobacillus sp. CQH2019]MDD9150921.1 DUF5412 family protein [Sporolactobacillus sp. CQH2019]